jgi:putative addiction module CopG family antidote
MKIHLRPELEEMIKQDVQRGPYQTVDEFVEHAVSLLHEQETWLAEHGSEIRTKIKLDEKKRAWLAEKRQA